jgi:hypothetical protein
MLRGFWSKSSNHLVGKLLLALIRYFKEAYPDQVDKQASLIAKCTEIANALYDSEEIIDQSLLSTSDDDPDFQNISEAIKRELDANRPDLAIDRLHTFMVKYSRRLCTLHEIDFSKHDALNCVFGKYTKWLRDKGYFQTEMTSKIMGSYVQILEKFNQVRNDKSLAHDNPILSLRESVFIFQSVCNIVKFVDDIEQDIMRAEENVDDDVPF